MEKWKVKFAYSGSGRREFFEIEFTPAPGQDINKIISDYVTEQNKGESKSDRIRVWSKNKIISTISTSNQK